MNMECSGTDSIWVLTKTAASSWHTAAVAVELVSSIKRVWHAPKVGPRFSMDAGTYG